MVFVCVWGMEFYLLWFDGYCYFLIWVDDVSVESYWWWYWLGMDWCLIWLVEFVFFSVIGLLWMVLCLMVLMILVLVIEGWVIWVCGLDVLCVILLVILNLMVWFYVLMILVVNSMCWREIFVDVCVIFCYDLLCCSVIGLLNNGNVFFMEVWWNFVGFCLFMVNGWWVNFCLFGYMLCCLFWLNVCFWLVW